MGIRCLPLSKALQVNSNMYAWVSNKFSSCMEAFGLLGFRVDKFPILSISSGSEMKRTRIKSPAFRPHEGAYGIHRVIRYQDKGMILCVLTVDESPFMEIESATIITLRPHAL